MTLLELLNSDMKQAMKNKDKIALSVIRMVKAALQNEQIKLGRELTDDDMLTVLTRELKQRKDSLHEFTKANRDDLVADVEAEIEVLAKYLPKQLSEDELRKLVEAAVLETGASSKKDMGKVMSNLMPKVKGKADGALVNKLVQELLP